MRPKQHLILASLSSVAVVLSLGLAACSQGSSQSGGQSTSAQTPDMTMPGMDHGSGSAKPGMSHDGMNMSLGPKDENFDLRFIDAMIPHHEGAVTMAQEALQKSSRPEIKKLAQSIIQAQQQEISQMQSWRKAWYPTVGDTPMMYNSQMGHMMPMTEEMRSSMMMQGDLGAADQQFDLRFINAMIPHHEGAVTMAQEALEKSSRPEIKQLAQGIIDSQQQEINQMNQWKKAWYGQ